MSEISVTLPDGSSRRLPAGSTPADVAGQISPRLAKAALAAVVDDKLVDLTFACACWLAIGGTILVCVNVNTHRYSRGNELVVIGGR